MTIIATLPAGRYALLTTSLGWHTTGQGDCSAIPGIGTNDCAYVTNPDDAMLRAQERIYQPVPSQDGAFESASGPAARVTLHGAEAHYPHADDIMMAVQTPSGTMACTRVMVVVPAPTMEHDRVSGTMWRIVDSAEPIVVAYADCVLRVGDETIDLTVPQCFEAGMSGAIRPGDGVYELLGCPGLPKHLAITRLPITQEMVDALTAIGTPIAGKTLERAMHFGIGGELDLMPIWITGPADEAPVHLTSYGADWVIRHDTPVYDLLSPTLTSSNQMMVENADRKLIERLRAVGVVAADRAAEVVTGFLAARTGGRAYFSAWRERLPIAA